MRVSTTVVGLVAVCGFVAAVGWSFDDRMPECRIAPETHRPLSMRTPTDVQHLRDDLKLVNQAASEFGEAVRRLPLMSESPDAIEGKRTGPERARAWCQDVLLTTVSEVHAVDAATIHQLAGGENGIAVAER
jgi:hypothetical protein